VSCFAVIDTETTGLSPAYHHRIVEIAVVLANDDGEVIHEWVTLVNPERDLGSKEIHGLSAADVYSAPTFRQVAGDIECLLRSNVLVAHNLLFDAAFVAAEFQRLGHEVLISPSAGLCTLRLASRYLTPGPLTLEACCERIGCRIQHAHSALDDARAAARLLAYYLAADDRFLRTWSDVIRAARQSRWPGLTPSGVACVTRTSSAASAGDHFLSRLVARVPRREIHPSANSYLAVLDKALLDRQLSLHEQDELVSAAEMMGISRGEALLLHKAYLAGLVRIATEDGSVTAAERDELESVALLLGLGAADVNEALSGNVRASDFEVGGFVLKPGEAVVFTGEAPGIDRLALEYQARSLGLRVTSAVSGKTSLLVAADPDSFSGKARKARDLGVPIVDYETYRKMIDATF
jgi:DNA polymerase-3 subunit epsilon